MNKLTRSLYTGLATALFVAAPLVTGMHTASATTTNDFDLSVPVETVIWGEEGSSHELASKKIDSKYMGMTCDVTAVADNQHSVHPNNDITVSSGNTSVVLEDVEREGHVQTNAAGTLTLGSRVDVDLTLGEDKVFSGGMNINISCVEKEIEICRDNTVVTIKKSYRVDTDTDAPCPIPTINVCRDGKVVVIKETNKKDSDTAAPCPVHIDVCRDGAVVTILEDDKKSDDIDAPCTVSVCRDGAVAVIATDDRTDTDGDAPCEVKAAVVELPNTGAGSIAGVIGATFAGSTVVAQMRLRHKASKES